MSFTAHGDWLRAQPPRDTIHVRNLSTTAFSGTDAWGRKVVQPVQISVVAAVKGPLGIAAEQGLTGSIHYGDLSKRVLGIVQHGMNEQAWTHGLVLAKALRMGLTYDDLASAQIEICYPKASLYGDGIAYEYAYEQGGSGQEAAVLHIKNVRAACLVGMNPHEREIKQTVIANLWLENTSFSEKFLRYTNIERLLHQSLEELELKTLEALAENVVANIVRSEDGIRGAVGSSVIRLKLEKPIAVPMADAPAVEIYRIVQHDQISSPAVEVPSLSLAEVTGGE